MNKIIASKYLRISFLLFALLIIIGSLWPGILRSPEENLYVLQAEAFLQGRFDLPQYFPEAAIYNGRFYVPFPPFPALLLLPIVAILGTIFAKGTLVSIVLSVLNVILLARILKRLDIDSKSIPWIVASFFLGTAYWLSVCRSWGVWFFAHVVSVTCMFLAINEALGKGRGVLTGLFLGMAFLSRQLSIYSIFFLCMALWENQHSNTSRKRFFNILGFMISVAICVGAYLAFNWARFPSMFDTGYSYIYANAVPGWHLERVRRFGLFHPAYIPFNFIYLFLQGFHVEFSAPTYLSGYRMDPFGTSISFASPFVFIAFWAKWKRNLLWTAWISISITTVHMLFYHANGYVQPNAQRFSLDFLPLLIVLVALGTKRVSKGLWKAAMMYSIILNALALFFIPLLRKIAMWF